MEFTTGKPEIMVGLLDGPVAINHPDLEGEHIREIPGSRRGACTQTKSVACLHGPFVAGVLCAKRGSVAPAICPNCTLLVRPLFAETQGGSLEMPSATPSELAAAIFDSIGARARVLNLSVALVHFSSTGQSELEEALDYASRRGVIAVAAAGNQAAVGSSAITRHPWVIPVVAYDLQGRPIQQSNLGGTIGRRGLGAPGDDVTSLGADGRPITFGGTSAAVPFVTGAIALLWSQFPTATAAEMKFALSQVSTQRRTTIVPPLLDAWAAYQLLRTTYERR
jgi:subtilisin family serine protease